jgi:alcohol dehydrogenase
MRSTWSFSSAGQLVFGNGAVAEVGPLATRRGWQRVLIVTDQRLVAAGIVEPVLASLTSAGIATHVFDGGEPEPAVATAVSAAEAAKRFEPNAVLGLGGGSNMDLAKIVAVLLAHGGTPASYFGWDNVPGPVVPLIGVPTTAGTGSEVSHAAVLTDTDNHIKVSTLSPLLRPALAVVDPQLTRTCPPKVTADSGIDALTHAIEAYTATRFSDLEVPATLPAGYASAYEGAYPLGQALAEQAIRLVGQYLQTAVSDGASGEAREGMALAATTAGLAFSNCAVALVHGLEYPLGAVLHCSHGAGNGLLLPHVMRFNLPEREREFARIAELLGENIAGLTTRAAAERAISAVERLSQATSEANTNNWPASPRRRLPSNGCSRRTRGKRHSPTCSPFSKRRSRRPVALAGPNALSLSRGRQSAHTRGGLQALPKDSRPAILPGRQDTSAAGDSRACRTG